MSIYVTADKHGNILQAFSYAHNPETRALTADDVIVVCGDIGLGWNGADKEYKYVLEWLSNRPESFLFVRGNHDNTDVIRNHSKSTCGDGKVVRLVSGTLCNPCYGDKIYKNVYWVPDAAILDLCGDRSLVIGGSASHDIDNLVSAGEKDRIKRLKSSHKFYRVIGESWWPDEGVNIPYAFSLINDYLSNEFHRPYFENAPYYEGKRYGNFKYVFTHDCPEFMCHIYARPGYPGRLRPTVNEEFLEIVREHINYRWFIHGHMHTFLRYAVEEDDYGQHECICLYKELFKLPQDGDNFQDWEFVCQCAQVV